MANLTQQRLFFAITLIIISVNSLSLQANSNASDSYESLKATPAPHNPIYEQIARRLTNKLGLFTTSGDTLSIISWPDAQLGETATTTSIGFEGQSYRHYFIRINEPLFALFTPDEQEFLIAHEVEHIYLNHHTSSTQDLHTQERAADIAAVRTLGTSRGALSFFEKQHHLNNTVAHTHPSYTQRIAYLKELDLLT